jgi:hypothetical protein
MCCRFASNRQPLEVLQGLFRPGFQAVAGQLRQGAGVLVGLPDEALELHGAFAPLGGAIGLELLLEVLEAWFTSLQRARPYQSLR